MSHFLEICIDFSKLGAQKAAPSLFTVDNNSQHYCVKHGNSELIKLRRRTSYPVTHCQATGETAVVGYGSSMPLIDDEFLSINLTKSVLTIKRDLFATLPFFYSFVNGLFVASNNFAWVVSQTPNRTLNRFHVIETLQPNPDRHTTLWEEIHILDERQTLMVNSTGIRIDYPQSRNRDSIKSATSSPKDFGRVLTEVLDSFCATRLATQNFGFEVSGGIDSSLLPLYLSHDPQIRERFAGSMIFPGSYGSTQLEKLSNLCQYAGLLPLQTTIDTETDYPLARFSDNPAPSYSFEEIYSEALDKLAKKFQEAGVKVVATGIGGDEIFENILSPEHELMYGYSERQRRIKRRLAPFLTPSYENDYVNSVPTNGSYPLPLLGVSLQGAQLARNNAYIERDIWPVSPFAQLSLYNFCQALPVHFRANKNILRAYYQAHQWPESIYNPSQNENFAVFFTQATMSNGFMSLVQHYSKQSVLHQMGYININMLNNYYLAICARERSDTEWLFNIFTWLGLEINLQVSAK